MYICHKITIAWVDMRLCVVSTVILGMHIYKIPSSNIVSQSTNILRGGMYYLQEEVLQVDMAIAW